MTFKTQFHTSLNECKNRGFCCSPACSHFVLFLKTITHFVKLLTHLYFQRRVNSVIYWRVNSVIHTTWLSYFYAVFLFVVVKPLIPNCQHAFESTHSDHSTLTLFGQGEQNRPENVKNNIHVCHFFIVFRKKNYCNKSWSFKHMLALIYSRTSKSFFFHYRIREHGWRWSASDTQ